MLVVDDEIQIRRLLRLTLESNRYRVFEASTGNEGLLEAAQRKPDVIILDLGLPDIDGLTVLKRLREWSHVPVLILSVKDQEEEKVAALDHGADDYVTKPFSAEVLLARINANLRKWVVREVGQPDLANGPIRMDLVRHEVFIDEERIALTPKEYDLLRYFLINRGRMLTHKQILKEVWGPAHVEDTQYLRVYIGQVREKLENKPGLGKLIVSEAGIGYRMDIAPDKAAAAA